MAIFSAFTANRVHGPKRDRPRADLRGMARAFVLWWTVFLISLLNTADISARAAAPEQGPREVVLTEAEKSWLKAHPDIVLGFTDSFEPEVIVDPDGTRRGMLVDFLDELNRRLGTGIDLRLDPIPDLLAKAQGKEIDGILEIHPDYADSLGLLKTKGYFSAYPAVFARKGDSFGGVEDFSGRRVAIIDKVHFSEKMIEPYRTKASVLKVKDALEGLRYVSSGEADLFLGVSLNSYYINKYQLFDVGTKYVFYDYPDKFGMAVRPDWPELVTILNKGISSFTADEIEALAAQWGRIPRRQAGIELTDEERAWLALGHTVRVGVGEYPPTMFSRNGKPFGIAIDVLDIISQRSGITFRYDIGGVPFRERVNGLVRHAGPDLLPSIQSTPEREEKILFTREYLVNPRFIFTRDDFPFISETNELAGKTVAVEKGFLVEKWLNEDYPDINLRTFGSSREALRAVSSGKADAYIGPLRPTATMINQFGFNNLKAVVPSGLPDGVVRMGIRSDWPELMTIVNKSLDSLSPGELTAITNKWTAVKFDSRTGLEEVYKWILAVAGGALCILLLLAVWARLLKKQVRQRTAELVAVNRSLESEIAERTRTEEVLRYQATLLENVSDSVVSTDMDYRVTSWNMAAEEVYGWSAEEAAGKRFSELTAMEFPAGSREEMLDRLNRDGLWRGEVLQRRKDGESIFVQSTVSLLKDEEGTPVGIVGVGRDVTEQRKAQDLLEESEKRFRSTFDQAAVGIAHVGLEGRFLRVNRKFCDITGYSTSEMLDLTFQEITHPEDLEKDLEQTKELREGKRSTYSMEKRYVRKDSNIVWISLTVSLLRDGNGTPQWFVSVVEDISRRRLAEEALRDSEEKFRSLMEQSPLSIQLVRPDGTIRKVNEAFRELWGISEEELPAVLEKYNMLEDEEIRKRGVMPLVEKAFRGERVTLPVIEYDAASTMENLEIGAVKARRRWIQARLYPVRNSKGELVSVVDIEEDITARMVAEKKIEEHRKRLKALASQLTLAEESERSRIATDLHDRIGQTLAFVLIQLARAEKASTNKKTAAALEEISETLSRVIGDTRDLIFDLSPPLMIESGLEAAVREWLVDQVAKVHGISTEFYHDGFPAVLEKDLGAILFRNVRELLTNVVKHAEAEKVSVRFSSSDGMMRIAVEDDGTGFDPQSAASAPSKKGGFGLFSIRERMEDYGGTLEIISAPGEGCRAILEAPIDIS